MWFKNCQVALFKALGPSRQPPCAGVSAVQGQSPIVSGQECGVKDAHDWKGFLTMVPKARLQQQGRIFHRFTCLRARGTWAKIRQRNAGRTIIMFLQLKVRCLIIEAIVDAGCAQEVLARVWHATTSQRSNTAQLHTQVVLSHILQAPVISDVSEDLHLHARREVELLVLAGRGRALSKHVFCYS